MHWDKKSVPTKLNPLNRIRIKWSPRQTSLLLSVSFFFHWRIETGSDGERKKKVIVIWWTGGCLPTPLYLCWFDWKCNYVDTKIIRDFLFKGSFRIRLLVNGFASNCDDAYFTFSRWDVFSIFFLLFFNPSEELYFE